MTAASIRAGSGPSIRTAPANSAAQRGDHSPRYSPDGSKIVFFSTRTTDGADNGDAEIFTMNTNGTKPNATDLQRRQGPGAGMDI